MVGSNTLYQGFHAFDRISASWARLNDYTMVSSLQTCVCNSNNVSVTLRMVFARGHNLFLTVHLRTFPLLHPSLPSCRLNRQTSRAPIDRSVSSSHVEHSLFPQYPHAARLLTCIPTVTRTPLTVSTTSPQADILYLDLPSYPCLPGCIYIARALSTRSPFPDRAVGSEAFRRGVR